MNRKWWKLYFVLALVLTAFTLVFPLFFDADTHSAWWEWLNIPLYIVELVGLFGFAFWRRIAIPLYWKILFCASLAYETSSVYSMIAETESQTYSTIFVASIIAVTMLMQLPLLVALFMYGFRCKNLWQDTDLPFTSEQT